jgi:hypothetical protein
MEGGWKDAGTPGEFSDEEIEVKGKASLREAEQSYHARRGKLKR